MLGEPDSGSPFYSDKNLFNSLAIFPKPFRDEPRDGWLHRVAYLNCLKFSDLYEQIETYLPYSRLCDFPKVMSPPDGVKEFLVQRGYKTEFTHSFCPHCFIEMKEPYYKKEWDYQWVHHCLDHGTPLVTSGCRECRRRTFYDRKKWLANWMACDQCLSVLNEWNDPVYMPEKHICKISPNIRKIIQLLESDPVNEKQQWILRKVFALHHCVTDDYSYYSMWNYSLLSKLGLKPLDYRTSKVVKYDRYSQVVSGLTPDQALSCAWDILHNMPQIIPTMARYEDLYSRDITRILLE